MSIQCCDISNHSFIDVLERHHIDIGILQGMEESCELLVRSTFKHRRIVACPSLFLLTRSQTRKGSAKEVSDNERAYKKEKFAEPDAHFLADLVKTSFD